MKQKYSYLIGIDEAGRGPLAGPLVVAGVRVAAGFDGRMLWGIKDSKKLTEKQRERWFEILVRHPEIQYAVVKISPAVIDKINILNAAHKGAQSVYEKLCTSIRRRIEVQRSMMKNTSLVCHALLDGSLKLQPPASYEVIIKGDEKIPLISAASIIAKVTRDRLMRDLHKKYPHYGFDVHKGYGTKKHARAIKKYGLSSIHRKSFRLKNTYE
jgi:ribonuclease HII